jgi:CheY-like chemotaxis protein
VSLSSAFLPVKDPATAVPPKRKRVLLVDSSRAKRDLRSETMRKLGVEVDCAADISEARCWWRPGLYDLVLIHVVDDDKPVERFCDDVRNATPPQQVMFLVRGPAFLAVSPDGSGQAEENALPVPAEEAAAADVNLGSDGKPQRWGLLEACRRISAIRSVCDARTRAIHNRPEPRRDSEISSGRRVLDNETVEMIGEEVQ